MFKKRNGLYCLVLWLCSVSQVYEVALYQLSVSDSGCNYVQIDGFRNVIIVHFNCIPVTLEKILIHFGKPFQETDYKQRSARRCFTTTNNASLIFSKTKRLEKHLGDYPRENFVLLNNEVDCKIAGQDSAPGTRD